MKKKVLIISSCTILTVALMQAKMYKEFQDKKVQYNLPKANTIHTVTKEIVPFKIYYTPRINKSFVGFKEALAFRESQGKYYKVNGLGYLGKYQFGKSTLHRLKIYDTQAFLNNPKQQEEAFIALCSLNKWILKRDIKRSVGKKINGIEITESGILAAAHLAGAGNVKNYLRSNGSDVFIDGYGTSIQSYMKKFAGYDTSFIKPIKNASL